MQTVYPVGTKVVISGDIPGVVAAIRINGVGVDYLVAWWDGKNRHNEFLDTFEIKFESEPTLEIGFHANGATNNAN